MNNSQWPYIHKYVPETSGEARASATHKVDVLGSQDHILESKHNEVG